MGQAAHTPGNSVREIGERIKGGAVKDERSPENEAILFNIHPHIPVEYIRNYRTTSGT